MNPLHVLVMAKSPVPGAVKTRLCPPCSLSEAAELAEAALRDTLDAVAGSAAERVLLALEGPPGPWIPPGVEMFAQSGATFAERLDHAWMTAGGPGLQIGMDTPQVSSSLIDACLDALLGRDANTAVLGLARDGGWWALGVQQPLRAMFDGVEMSTSTTGRAQQARLESMGFDVLHLPVLVDVDVADDALEVALEIPSSRFGALVVSLDIRSRLNQVTSWGSSNG
jgi:glycosyltransferase A (GT-A) superfamily protein (DUF2064 family)